MRWIITGLALALAALAGADAARACGGCCCGTGGCPNCPQNGSSSGPARPAAGPGTCPNCPRGEAATGAYRQPGTDAGYYPYSDPAPRASYSTPAADGRDRPVATQPVASLPPPAPVITHSTSYRPASWPGQSAYANGRPAR